MENGPGRLLCLTSLLQGWIQLCSRWGVGVEGNSCMAAVTLPKHMACARCSQGLLGQSFQMLFQGWGKMPLQPEDLSSMGKACSGSPQPHALINNTKPKVLGLGSKPQRSCHRQPAPPPFMAPRLFRVMALLFNACHQICERCQPFCELMTCH